ncbi:nucleoid-associated protein [Vallitalea pronyensis]|uniref:Nucleoid-associated protein n=1 Tax=Vallitalea pronyensis TaxID=1348613 RepID=A0A8J8MN08_9FIRM|nr:nucleoid-associated protein [Vallitalea pronyensis]QUI24442.1 nucleoid-associated protein [Vallitalea pronyensis]
MYTLEDIKLYNMIVHILDSSLSVPVLSMEEMESNYDIKEFFANHLVKTLNDDSLKQCQFQTDYNMVYNYIKEYTQDDSRFVEMSINIANQLFSIMNANSNIPSADLAVVAFGCRGTKYLALLKLNYLNSFIHYTETNNNANVNQIIQHRTTLPNSGQKINEVIVINLSTLGIDILEKKYEIDGQKEFYLSLHFLKCQTNLSSKEQYNIVKKATDTITKKYFDEDVEKKMDIQQELYHNIEESGDINLDTFANEAFKNHVDIKKEFMETINEKGLEEPVIHLTEKTITRSFEKQKLKTDTGIELKIPMELYNDPDNIEFITNPDGNISIVIKNIKKIIH